MAGNLSGLADVGEKLFGGKNVRRICCYCYRVYGESCPVCGKPDELQLGREVFKNSTEGELCQCENGHVFARADGGDTHGICKTCFVKVRIPIQIYCPECIEEHSFCYVGAKHDDPKHTPRWIGVDCKSERGYTFYEDDPRCLKALEQLKALAV